MATLPKINLDPSVSSLLPKDSLIRSLAEGNATDFASRVNAVAKKKVDERIQKGTETLKQKGLLGVFKK